ncbi:subtilisin-like protease SBT2.4 [Andrographis paniculata]|uniref:subtilisin-like protease SBT2.4 n=1 Tax=Andrographis paniculata TaxID=175694 RepID=UPI0021E88665|nr:subtilisin-like protease SBT2.4 [Andrographis paniculata]
MFISDRRLPLLVILIFADLLFPCIAEERGLYVVLLDGKPVAFRQESTTNEKGRKAFFDSEASKAHAKQLADSHDRFLQTTLDAGSYNKLYSFKHVANGFAVHTTHSQAKKFENARGVKLVEKDRGAKLMTTHSPDFLGLPAVWAQRGGERNAGEGIVIGFVDSGINPVHPSFTNDILHQYTSNISHFSGACEGGPLFPPTSCNGKIVSARFFSAGAQAAARLNTSYDILSPYDAVGHGSHVSSTAAGNYEVPVVVDGYFYGRASGMAPRARIAMYKAIYPTIGTLTDVLAAIDQAVADGVDVLTLSIGPDGPPEEGTLTFFGAFELFMLSANKAGVLVVQAAGNHGPGPYSVISYSPWSVAVASSNTDRTYPGTLVLGDGHEISGIGLTAPSFGGGLLLYRLVLAKDAVRTTGTFPRTPQNVDECQSPDALDSAVVRGSVVICGFSAGFANGTSTLAAILATARALGFAGFVLAANSSYGDFIAEPIPFASPGIMIPRVSSVQIMFQYYQQQTIRDTGGRVIRYNARASIGEGRTASYTERAPIVSRFSSRGPDYMDEKRTPADVLKPDILAPGHQIWASWSPMSFLNPMLSGHNFALLSGTSMATPHVAGIAALLKQNNPSWTPAMIASAMSTTARNRDNLGEPIMAEGFAAYSIYPAAPFGYGAGFVNAARANDPGLVFPAGYEDYVGFLCSLPNTDPEKVRRAIGEACPAGAISGRPSDLNLPSVTMTALSGTRVTHRVVKNVGDKPETYLCAVLPPAGVAVSVAPEWFAVGPQESATLELKFTVTAPGEDFSFGLIVLTGSSDHIVRMPLSILPVSV